MSAARYVEDVNREPVILFDGLTKRFRYPGWRIGWALGPAAMVETLARTASALDGGPSRIAQRAAIKALEPARADQETKALREVFSRKRNTMLDRLTTMGVTFAHAPRGTFYCWGSLEKSVATVQRRDGLFLAGPRPAVMTVPGQFFDVNPGRRRRSPSPYERWMRFSFGPPMDNMIQGLDRLEAMLADSRTAA